MKDHFKNTSIARQRTGSLRAIETKDAKYQFLRPYNKMIIDSNCSIASVADNSVDKSWKQYPLTTYFLNLKGG